MSKEEIQAQEKTIEIRLAIIELIEALPKQIGKLSITTQVGPVLYIKEKKIKDKCYYGEIVHAVYELHNVLLEDNIDDLKDLRSFLQEHKKLDKKLEVIFTKLFLLLESKWNKS